MNLFKSIGVAACALAAVALSTGCANVKDKSRSAHRVKMYDVAVAPGWTVVKSSITNSPTGNQVAQFSVVAPTGTNQPGFLTALVNRPKVWLAYDEEWTDESKGGGTFLLTDPQASALLFARTNQAALGGSHIASVGALQSTITTNAVAAIAATGTAVGNVIGAAASAAAK